jgi:hypothetical protein
VGRLGEGDLMKKINIEPSRVIPVKIKQKFMGV